MSDTKTKTIELSMYGVAEIMKWCVERNDGRIPGVDSNVFKKMREALDERPKVGDYYVLDNFYKTRKNFEFTHDEVVLVDRCLYDIPNFDGAQLPQIRYRFWPTQEEIAASAV